MLEVFQFVCELFDQLLLLCNSLLSISSPCSSFLLNRLNKGSKERADPESTPRPKCAKLVSPPEQHQATAVLLSECFLIVERAGARHQRQVGRRRG